MEPTQRDTFNLNGVLFYSDSLTEDGIKLIDSINQVVEETKSLRIKTDITNIAKDALINQLVELSTEFEKVEEEKPKPKAKRKPRVKKDTV